MHDEPRHPAETGFTLAELLVVVAILSLLVSIVAPSLVDMRRLARRATCASNLKSWGVACASYANDHRQWLPNLGGSPIEIFDVHAPTARALLEPYGLSARMAFCPDSFLDADFAASYAGSGAAQWGYSYFPHRQTRQQWQTGTDEWTPTKLSDHEPIRGTRDRWPLVADVTCGHNVAAWTPSRPWAWTHANHPDRARPEGVSMYTYRQMYLPFGLNNCQMDGAVAWIDFDRLDMAKHYHAAHWKYCFHWE